MTVSDALRVGVIGVGRMGANHARVYSELASADLVGVTDDDVDRAASVASEYGATPMGVEDLLDRVDAVSVAVPSEHHYDVVGQCLAAGVDVLVEKPFVLNLERGRDLARRARDRELVVQVGHVERFNPAVEALMELAPDLEVVACTAHRLGPPIERDREGSVVVDLMVHDVDVLVGLFDAQPVDVSAIGCRDGQYASAQLAFETGQVATLTASRLTQRKVRQLELTARECQIVVDYLDQSIRIHRRSRPAYAEDDGDLLYRQEQVTERPLVESEEPLKRQLESFVETVRTRGTPRVDATTALEVLSITRAIEDALPALQAEVVDG